MSDETKKGRREWIRGLNFGGTTDWALDLADYYEGPHSEGDWNVDIESPECNQDDWPTSLEGFDTNMDQLPIHCRGMALTRFLAVSMNDAIEEFTKVSEGYDDKVSIDSTTYGNTLTISSLAITPTGSKTR